MPVGARELFLTIRAKDEARRVLQAIGRDFSTIDKQAAAAAGRTLAAGAALASIGVGIGIIGTAGIQFMYGATQAAVEYQRQTALTLTQADNVGATMKNLGDIGKRVGREIGVPFETLQSSLYDIFSSMNVSVPQAETLLRAFAKGAVAGQTDIQTAGRATIAIMNAFKIPVKDVNKVMDFQFQLVRKGVGTYEQFARTIGLALPAAARAGQSYQTLGGMLAYLTRNGLSTSRAATSAARALEAMSNPQVAARLKEMGVNVKDANGEFRPMGGILVDLRKKLEGLTGPQRAAALRKLFLGAGGTIQARRFYDLVLKDNKQVQAFLGLVDDMNAASGSMGVAYGQMADTIAVRQQLLNNRWQIMRVELGEALMPVLEALIGALSKVMDWWSRLSDTQKKYIGYAIAVGSALLVLIGIITAIVGVFLMLSAAAALAGVSLMAIGVWVAIAIAALAALIVIVIIVWKNWDTIWAFIKSTAETVVRAIVAAWNWLKSTAMSIWGSIGPYIMAVWSAIVTIVSTYVAIWIAVIRTAWIVITTIFRTLWSIIAPPLRIAWAMVTLYFTLIYYAIRTYLMLAWAVVRIVLYAIMAVFRVVWIAIKGIIWPIVKVIYQVIRIHFLLMYAIVRQVLQIMWSIISAVWSRIRSATATAWNAIKNYVINPIRTAFSIVRSVMNNIASAVSSAVNRAKSIARSAFSSIKSYLINPIRDAYSGVKRWIDNIVGAISGIVGKITGPIEKAAGLLSKLNPLKAFSPSLVDNTKRGFRALTSLLVHDLRRIESVADQYMTRINRNLEFGMGYSGPVVPGLAGARDGRSTFRLSPEDRALLEAVANRPVELTAEYNGREVARMVKDSSREQGMR